MREKLREQELSRLFELSIGNGAWAAQYPEFAHVVKEMDCQQGRPDFVASPVGPTAISATNISDLVSALSPPSSARVLSLLKPASYRTEAYILRNVGLSKQVVRRAILRLERLNLVKRSVNSAYALSPSFPELKWELWAFEIKVDHWKRALYQALQYKAFAHRVAVVIAERWVHRAERHIDRFKLFKVGLIAIDAKTGGLRCIHPPQKAGPASRHHYLYALGRFLGAVGYAQNGDNIMKASQRSRKPSVTSKQSANKSLSKVAFVRLLRKAARTNVRAPDSKGS